MRGRILIVDDEPDILGMLEDYFLFNDYAVLTACGGKEAIEKAQAGVDIILLDINMPDLDGWDVCRQIRDFVSCPILFLTARIQDADKIKGFALGGDDYIVKPFALETLAARVSAHLRREARYRQGTEQRVQFQGALTIDYSARSVSIQGKALPLAKKEFDIVELLASHAGQVFAKERIYDLLWGCDGAGDANVIAEHIRRIRQKCSALTEERYIETVWGVGYKWKK